VLAGYVRYMDDMVLWADAEGARQAAWREGRPLPGDGSLGTVRPTFVESADGIDWRFETGPRKNQRRSAVLFLEASDFGFPRCDTARIRFVARVVQPLMNVPDHLLFLDSHEWIDPADPAAASVGISDHAQEELTDVVYLELPAVGRVVTKGEPFAVIESVKAANDIYAPVSGEVVEVNEALVEAPESINTDPYGVGWMAKLRLSDPSELDSLLNAASYREHLS